MTLSGQIRVLKHPNPYAFNKKKMSVTKDTKLGLGHRDATRVQSRISVYYRLDSLKSRWPMVVINLSALQLCDLKVIFSVVLPSE